MSRPKKLTFQEVIPVIQEGVRKKESKVKIAQRLNISRNTLHYWIKMYPEIRQLFD